MRSVSAVDFKAEGITLANFRELLRDVICPCCHEAAGWGERPQPNASGIGVQCAACGETPRPWLTRYLPQGNNEGKRAKPPERPRETWARQGDCCFFCHTRFEDLHIIKANYQQQHAWGYRDTEHEGPIVPICSACHPHASALFHRHRLIIDAYKAREKGDAA